MNFQRTATAILASAAILATTIAPTFAMQPVPTTHLTDAASSFNPKVMVAAGQPTETYGFLAPSRFLEITTLKLEGVSNTTVTLTYAGVDRHVNLIPDGRAVLVDFGAGVPSAQYSVDGGAWLLVTYSSQRATAIITDVRAASAPVTS